MYYEGTFSNARNGAMVEFMGTDGTINLDRGGYQIFPERGRGKFEERILGSDPVRGRDFYDKPDGELLHLTNWLDCVRNRKTPNCPAQAGVSSASAAHLGNLGLSRPRCRRVEKCVFILSCSRTAFDRLRGTRHDESHSGPVADGDLAGLPHPLRGGRDRPSDDDGDR